MAALESAGLVSIETLGRERFCQAHPGQLKSASEWLSFYDQFWSSSLDRLGNHHDG
ncbi:MAG: hypothetical protein ABJH04_06295 [Cyclobacteriaceae bacterium]